VAETVRVSLLHAASLAVMTEQGTQTGRCHALAAHEPFEGDKQSVRRSLRPFEPQIVVEELGCLWGHRQESGLVAFAAHPNLRFRQQQIVAPQIQDLLRPKPLQQHHSDDGQVP
jgi:hypothetical protein